MQLFADGLLIFSCLKPFWVYLMYWDIRRRGLKWTYGGAWWLTLPKTFMTFHKTTSKMTDDFLDRTLQPKGQRS